jgi:hypothetical protein
MKDKYYFVTVSDEVWQKGRTGSYLGSVMWLCEASHLAHSIFISSPYTMKYAVYQLLHKIDVCEDIVPQYMIESI